MNNLTSTDDNKQQQQKTTWTQCLWIHKSHKYTARCGNIAVSNTTLCPFHTNTSKLTLQIFDKELEQQTKAWDIEYQKNEKARDEAYLRDKKARIIKEASMIDNNEEEEDNMPEVVYVSSGNLMQEIGHPGGTNSRP